MRVGKAVKWIREQRGMTASELGKKIDMPSGQLWRIENTRDQVRDKSLYRVCEGLEIDKEVLYYLTLVFETEGKLMRFSIETAESLQHELKQHYNLDLDITIGI